MGRHEPSSQEVISSHPVGRLLAIPAKGQRGRKLAMAGYGLFVAGTFTALTVAPSADRPPSTSERKDVGGPETETYRAHDDPGYLPTYLDGGGGIAGVPLTEEQRRALIREAMRRGMSERDAYALAYGDNATIHRAPDGTMHVHPEKVVVPNGPVYRKAAPSELKAVVAGAGRTPVAAQGASDASQGTKTSGESSSAAGKPEKVTEAEPKAKGSAGGSAPDAGTVSDDSYYPTSGERVYEDESKLKDALPPPLERIVDQIGVFSAWLDTTSPSTPQSFGVVGAEGDTLRMTVAAPLAHDLAVATTVEASLDGEPEIEPVVTSVVTDAGTGEVLAKNTDTCPSVAAVDAVAIGQVVDVVLEARGAA
ncbi:hypothetical protein ACIBAI_05655 [Streptomyces sp. NPDC051041]|uniref:hypothetical protein n=1 Tax=Streptomyces sp. NPDC051041 TaxID=3365640 RepID=UPI0037964FE6